MKSTVPECRDQWEWRVLNVILKKWSRMILRKGAKSLNLIEFRISKIDFYFGSLNIRLICVNFKKLWEKFKLTKSKLTNLIKLFTLIPPQQLHLTDWDREVINCTRSHVKNNSKLTNFMKISRIEGYNGKYGPNPQRIREISYDLFEFDQIEWWIDDRNLAKW